jgi:hypothetical protein
VSGAVVRPGDDADGLDVCVFGAELPHAPNNSTAANHIRRADIRRPTIVAI